MEQRKTLNIRFPQELVEKLRELKKTAIQSGGTARDME